MENTTTTAPVAGLDAFDPAMSVEAALAAVHSTRTGITAQEAALRLERYGPNLLAERTTLPWWRPVLAQFVHPLAVLLIAAGALSFYSDSSTLGWTIWAVVVLNAAFALIQEHQAERAVGALSAFLPSRVTALRDGEAITVDIATLVPGDVVRISEGQRISADGRVVAGEIEVDLSTLNGESVPSLRTAAPAESSLDLLASSNLVFSGTTCTSGSADALVLRTGEATELGRIAALTREPPARESPLERQVRRLAKLVAVVAVVSGLAFLPIGLAAGLSFKDSFLFATGLLVANVPEGLLPIITLALAAGANVLARRGVVVKRLSAVETLGSATAICTDKTGTLTQNRMTPVAAWTTAGELPIAAIASDDVVATVFGRALGACATANGAVIVTPDMDPTEAALLTAAQILLAGDLSQIDTSGRRHVYPFESVTRLMSTVDTADAHAPSGPHLVVHTKGAPEVVVARCTSQLSSGGTVPLDARTRFAALQAAEELSRRGLRVLALADRDLGTAQGWPSSRDEAESDLRLLGYVALVDPPREQVPDAVRRCHQAGLRVHVVSGDSKETAAEIARQVGIGQDGIHVITGAELDAMTDEELRSTFAAPFEVVCARSTPENKLRITGVLQDEGEVVAVTGDGVNDAPSLRKADIGIAMGSGGTDVAREAADAVLVDNDFSALAAAVEEGRRVYDNVRKFIVFIFSHAVPEVVPFLVFALSGGAVPLPITVLQILAIDLGAETLCALALARERAEPGVMTRPPKPLAEPLVTAQMLWRSWGVLGATSAVLTMAAFFYVLVTGGWGWGDSVESGTALHGTYVEATTATFAAIVACQMGTAVAARTSRASLSSIGWASNRLLLIGIIAGFAFAGTVIYLPLANQLVHTAPLSLDVLLVVLPFPFVVWGVDEVYRARLRRRAGSGPA